MGCVDNSDVSPAEFARLMEGLHADVQDSSFVYEGWSRGVPLGQTIEEDLKAGTAHRDGEADYQGGYSFRADGATRLDIYIDYTRDNKAHKSFSSRKLEVILDHKRLSIDQMPDQRNEQETVSGGIPGVFNHPCSPERINYDWFFRTLGDPTIRHYEFLGWEDIDGHRCLSVQLDEVWGLPDQVPERPTVRFWIDIERGGHPLQVEFRRGEKIRMRVADVKLESQVGADGRERWFPVRGVAYMYIFLGRDFTNRPVAYETYEVLDGTVRFNQNLPDAFFSLDWKGSVPENEQLATRRKEFRKPPRRYDPEGIKQHLAEALAAAEKQSAQLEASSPAREQWSWTTLAQASLATVGVATLLGVAIRRWGRP
jgi:hypothetical protein